MATLEEALAGLNYTGADTGYGIAAQTLNQMTPQLINPYGSTGQAVGIGLGSILLQSLLGYQARQQASQDTLELNSLANQLMTKATPEARTEFIGGVSDPMYQGRLSTLSTALMQQEATRKAKAADKLLELETAAKFNLGDLGTQLFEREQTAKMDQLAASHPPKPGPTTFGPQEPVIKKGFFGEYETTADKRNRLIKEASNLGVPPSDRLDYANRNLKTEELQTKQSLDELKKSREAITNADYIISRATSGIAGAGETGGPTLYAGARDIASSIYQYLPTKGGKEEATQRAAQKELDSIRPEIIKNLRSPGAVSNYEDKLLIGAGPSSSNTQAENIRILSNMIEYNKLNNEYVNFLETYIQDKGDASGAAQLWDRYKKDQVIKNNQINPDRLPWADYFKQKKEIGVSDNTSVQDDIATLRQILAQPVSEATKAAAQDKLNQLLGQ